MSATPTRLEITDATCLAIRVYRVRPLVCVAGSVHCGRTLAVAAASRLRGHQLIAGDRYTRSDERAVTWRRELCNCRRGRGAHTREGPAPACGWRRGPGTEHVKNTFNPVWYSVVRNHQEFSPVIIRRFNDTFRRHTAGPFGWFSFFRWFFFSFPFLHRGSLVGFSFFFLLFAVSFVFFLLFSFFPSFFLFSCSRFSYRFLFCFCFFLCFFSLFVFSFGWYFCFILCFFFSFFSFSFLYFGFLSYFLRFFYLLFSFFLRFFFFRARGFHFFLPFGSRFLSFFLPFSVLYEVKIEKISSNTGFKSQTFN